MLVIIFYEDGVKSVDDPLWNIDFKQIYTHSSLQVPWYNVLGNHDWRGNPQAEIDYSKIDKRWILPNNYYSFKVPISNSINATFIMLDTTPIVDKTNDYKAQLEWLDTELYSTKDDWVFVAGHHYVYDSVGHLKQMHDLVNPILRKHNVTVYISGHRHRLEFLTDKKVHYIISGAGSRIDNSSSLDMTAATSEYVGRVVGVVIVELQPKVMLVNYFDKNGLLLFKREIIPNIRNK